VRLPVYMRKVHVVRYSKYLTRESRDGWGGCGAKT
jgi:hypothetical protein